MQKTFTPMMLHSSAMSQIAAGRTNDAHRHDDFGQQQLDQQHIGANAA